jgi:hypothetical protein
MKQTRKKLGAAFSTFVTDFDEFQKCAEIRVRYLGVATPTSTTVGVTRLAGPEFMIEIRLSPSSIPEKLVRAVPSAGARKPDPSTGQTGSVAAPIEEVLSKGDWLLDAVGLPRSQQELRR